MIASAQTRAAAAVAAETAMVWGEHKTACPVCSLPARKRIARCATGGRLFADLAAANADLAIQREADSRPAPDQPQLDLGLP